LARLLHAAGDRPQAGERRARGEQLDHPAAVELAGRLVDAGRELRVGVPRGERQRAIGSGHRWHVVQVVSEVTRRSLATRLKNIRIEAVQALSATRSLPTPVW